MLQPSCEQKEHLLAVYMEAVHAHYELVGLLKAVCRQRKSFRTVLRNAKRGAYAVHAGEVGIGATLQNAQMLTGRFSRATETQHLDCKQ
jgi:hypothetical protein